MNLRLVVSAAALLLCGCQTLSSWAPSWFPSIPTPSFAWLGFGHSSKPAVNLQALAGAVFQPVYPSRNKGPPFATIHS